MFQDPHWTPETLDSTKPYSLMPFPSELSTYYTHCCRNSSLKHHSKMNMTFFFLLSSLTGRFVLTIRAQKLEHTICFFSLFKLSTNTFSFKGNMLWLLFDLSELPAPLLLCFGVINKQNKDGLNTRTGTIDLMLKMATEWLNSWAAHPESICWTKEWFISRTGQNMTQWDLITLPRTVCNLKLTNCLFLAFSI